MLRQAQHERDGVVHRLKCHSDTPARKVSAVDVEWLAADQNEALLIVTVMGAGELILPEPASPNRADELWRTTCFELFWKPAGGAGYFEFNFSPSGRWAAYAFDGYRSGMRDHPMAVAPHIEVDGEGERLVAEIDIDFSTLPNDATHLSLSAVIEERDGTKSYWALAHPPGKPDFHDDACFVLDLPAPDAA